MDGRLYLVGGAVRNSLLEIPITDEDYCVVGINEENFIKVFPQAIPQGKFFKVYRFENKEFALARKETKKGVGHKNFDIISNERITIEEDLARRDITINSIAKDVLTSKIIDPFNGQEDLKKRIIRATTQAFKEDPLRVYRVARFASLLNFNIDKYTIEFMNSLKEELSFLSKERVFKEFKKALQTNKPSIFFNVLKNADVLDIHFIEIFNLIGAIQPIKYHPEGDSFNHTMQTLDNVAKTTESLEIRFGALVHDLGKGTTEKRFYPHHYGHDIRGAELVGKLGNRIGVPRAWIKCGKVSATQHMRGGIFTKMTPKKQVNFIEQTANSMLGLEGLEKIVEADRNRGLPEIKTFNFAKIGNKMLEQVSGEYIKKTYNIKEGKEFGEILKEERIKWIKNIDY